MKNVLRWGGCAFMLGVLLVGRVASGAVKDGDKPVLAFENAIGGGKVDLAALRGEIVVVDFWATWCGPCMAEAGHMVQLNERYSKQGLQIVGISLDDDRTAMAGVVKQKGFIWPQYFDGLAWQNKVAVRWGVESIPATFILGPDGTVLWHGHPARIDSPLEKAFKEHPPKLADPEHPDVNKQFPKLNAPTAAEQKAAVAEKTFKYFAGKAAEGDAYGQYRLGMLYLSGEGTTKDAKLAREWLGKAAAQGDADAKKALATLPAN